MGCASSKQKRCRHCRSPYYAPVPRSYSMQVHHLPQSDGDSYHVVALTSSTLGSLKLDSLPDINIDDVINRTDEFLNRPRRNCDGEKDFLMEAKEWSDMIEEKIPKVIPKTPIRTPPGEPETINVRELMEGLEDVSPFWSPARFRSFSFDVDRSSNSNGEIDKPIWVQIAEEKDSSSLAAMVSDFDPEVISSFRKTLEGPSPENPFHLNPVNTKNQTAVYDKHSSPNTAIAGPEGKISKPREKVVLYFTSLRGIRKTYEDCCRVRVILKSLGLRLDERDVSMHSGFKEELRELLGQGFNAVGLPRVFLGRKHIGGADEIRRMHEDGQLETLLETCEKVEEGSENGGACEACGDIRFIPCETCGGSCKVYYESEEQDAEEQEQEQEEGDYGFQRCPDCNENGLVRCPICCY